MPLANSALFHSSPHINQTLPQIAHITHFSLLDSLLKYVPDFVVNWTVVMAERRPQISRDVNVGWFHSPPAHGVFSVASNQYRRITLHRNERPLFLDIWRVKRSICCRSSSLRSAALPQPYFLRCVLFSLPLSCLRSVLYVSRSLLSNVLVFPLQYFTRKFSR